MGPGRPRGTLGCQGLGLGEREPGQGRAPQEAEEPPAPVPQHQSLARQAPSLIPPRSAPILPSNRRAYLRPQAGHAASCACAVGNKPEQDEREAAPWCPPPAVPWRPAAAQQGVGAPRRFQPRCTDRSFSYCSFFSTSVGDVSTYHCFSSDAQSGARYGREEL